MIPDSYSGVGIVYWQKKDKVYIVTDYLENGRGVVLPVRYCFNRQVIKELDNVSVPDKLKEWAIKAMDDELKAADDRRWINEEKKLFKEWVDTLERLVSKGKINREYIQPSGDLALSYLKYSTKDGRCSACTRYQIDLGTQAALIIMSVTNYKIDLPKKPRRFKV